MVIRSKALALAIALGTGVVAMGCAQTSGGPSGSYSAHSGPYGSTVPGWSVSDDPEVNRACQNVPAIERDACISRAKERRSSTIRGS